MTASTSTVSLLFSQNDMPSVTQNRTRLRGSCSTRARKRLARYSTSYCFNEVGIKVMDGGDLADKTSHEPT